MTEARNQQRIDAPSKGALARATGVALFVALVLLFTAVLPAEYGSTTSIPRIFRAPSLRHSAAIQRTPSSASACGWPVSNRPTSS